MAQMQVESNGSFNNQSRIPVMKKGIPNQNSQSSTGGSRLEKMQHQFQKKLVKEKEEKMIQMYEDNQQRTINKVIRNSGKGLVRDFFRERRALEKMTQGGQDVPPIDVHFQQKKQQIITETDTNNKKQQNAQIPIQRRSLQKHSAGRDRSYPLAPIERHNTKVQNHTSPTSKTEQKSRLQQPQAKRYSGSGIPSYQKFQTNDKSITRNAQPHYIDDFEDNSDDADDDDDDDDSANESGSSDEENEPVIKSKMPIHRLSNHKQEEELQRLEKEIEEEEEKLRQEQELQLQSIKEKGKIQNHHMNGKQHNLKIKNNPPVSDPVNSESPEDQYDLEQDDEDEQKHERMPTPEGLASCPICGRHFAIDRIEKHSKVCEKTSKTKRKVFDPVKMRTQGTEMEQFRRKTNKNAEQISKKSNWRSKHESFIESIRQARTVQKHLASGGKLSDLPPPPPSENPDYVQCPHCQRRFNSDAAERHIPKCQSIGTKPPPATKNTSKNSKTTKVGNSKHK